MSCTLRALLLVLCVSFCANAQTRTLALYLGPASAVDAEARRMMRAELQQLLAPAAIDVAWKTLADRKSSESFDIVAVATFDKTCGGTDNATGSATASLADTSIADGHILPFFRIDCTHLMSILGRKVESAVLGRALARLAAHELYHIIAQTTAHQDAGVAKAAFSVHDLTAPRFELDAWSVTRMRPVPVIPSIDISYGDSAR